MLVIVRFFVSILAETLSDTYTQNIALRQVCRITLANPCYLYFLGDLRGCFCPVSSRRRFCI